MDDSRGVRHFESFDQRDHDRFDVAQRWRLREPLEPASDGVAVEQLHDDEEQLRLGILGELYHAHDVGVREQRGGAGFPAEPAHNLGATEQLLA